MIGKTLVRAAFAGAVVVASTVTMATTASAGQNGCAYVSFRDGHVYTQHNCGPNGTYHMDIFYPGVHRSTGGYQYFGGNRETLWNDQPANGTNVCAQLWRHKSDGGYESMGLPCEVK
ncbi:hypothetical protein OG394_08370 [Kribbella sp. NBC_01245]|uniref:hypothetical protein n=1 Tax=Kribbella sp. NBC_01245 TaxID=2903578 RepID=UPI002E299631|nr:hypothetical protein [Kribbella sp. NBC_01245]